MTQEETWVCVDGHGEERVFPRRPHRRFPNLQSNVLWGKRWTTEPLEKEYQKGTLLPKGTIKHLIGRDMTYSDEPIKIL